MADPYGKPSSSDRNVLLARIRKAAADGRISEADRDIRLRNVSSAQSATELDLIRRDLDQLAGTLAPTGQVVGGSAVPPASAQPVSKSPAGPIAAVLLVLGLVGALVVAGVLVFVVSGGGSGEDTATSESLPEAVPIVSEDAEPTDEPTAEEPAHPDGPAYELTGPGILAFLAAYAAKFGTTQVVELTMYDDYVVVRVPVPGKNRSTGWLYRQSDGWSDFGGTRANFPGTRPVDTTQIRIPALVRNIARARSTLGVEDYTSTYVNIDQRPQFDDTPNVDIYVSNEFNESGYLATRPDGSIERAYPFSG